MMQCKQHWDNMTVSGCVLDKSCCGILKTLQFEKMHSWYTIEKTVAIINACHDHALYKQFIDGGRRQELPYLSDIMQLIVDYLQVLLICSVILSLTSNHEPRLRTAELPTATVAWRKSRCAIFTLSSCCWVPTTTTTTTSFIYILL